MRCCVAPADVTDDAQIEAALEQIEAELGPIDILVNGAGIAELSRAEKHSREKWDRTLAVNLTGALAAGLVVGLVASRGFDDSVVAWLTTGFLGGYTTFSTWMVETNFAAAEGGSAGFRRAVANLAVPLVGGVALAYLGYWFGSMI